MSNNYPINAPTSPTLPTDPGIVHTPKEFSDNLTLDLTDSEIKKAFELIMRISNKWSTRFRYKFSDPGNFTVDDAAKLVDEFEHELHQTLAEKMDLLIQVDMSPVFEGQPLIVELIGALPTHYSAKHGMDHDKKEWEVKKSVERGESFYGEKYASNRRGKKS